MARKHWCWHSGHDLCLLVILQGILDVLGLHRSLLYAAEFDLEIPDLLQALVHLLWRLFLRSELVLDLLGLLDDAVEDFFGLQSLM